MRPLLEFQNISVMRGGTTVLDNITLRIQAGEHVAILGPNGGSHPVGLLLAQRWGRGRREAVAARPGPNRPAGGVRMPPKDG